MYIYICIYTYVFNLHINIPHGNENPKTYNTYTHTKRKEPKHYINKNHQITREETKKRRKEQRRTAKTIRKQVTKGQ